MYGIFTHIGSSMGLFQRLHVFNDIFQPMDHKDEFKLTRLHPCTFWEKHIQHYSNITFWSTYICDRLKLGVLPHYFRFSIGEAYLKKNVSNIY